MCERERERESCYREAAVVMNKDRHRVVTGTDRQTGSLFLLLAGYLLRN
jgi:hypothetical protein